jgi:hypothetical protein
MPIDEIKILRDHIEARNEELIRQRELIATMLKQNEELIKAIKSLQESQDVNFNPRAGAPVKKGSTVPKTITKESNPSILNLIHIE